MVSEDSLFTSISGTGLTGSYVRPTSNLNDPYAYILSNSPTLFRLAAANDNSYGIGLQTGGGSLQVHTFELAIVSGGPTLPYSGSYTDPISLLNAVTGTYSTIGTATSTLFTNEGAIVFDIDEVIITSDAVDVPFGVDSTVGLALLGAASAWKLRRRRKTV